MANPLRATVPSSPMYVRHRYSLRWRLLILLGLLFLTAFLLVGAGIDRFVENAEEQLWEERQGEASRYVAETVVQFLGHLRLSLALLGGLDAKEIHIDSPAVQSLLVSAPALLEVALLGPDGQVVAAAHLDKALLAAQPWLGAAQPAHNTMDIFLGGLEQTLTAQPYVVITTPTETGGLAAARLSVAALSDLLDRLHKTDVGHTYIVADDGRIVAHSDPDLVTTASRMTGRPEWAAMLAAPDRIWYGHYVNFQGLEVVGGTAPVAGADWLVVTEAPQELTYVMRTRARQLVVGSTILFGLMVMVVGGFFLHRMLLLPLTSLRTGVERIGHGDLEYRIPTASWNELGQLALAINQMAARLADREQALRKTSDELEVRVHERTAALAAANEDLRAEVEVRRAAEEALRESELRYRTLFETAPVGIFTKTLDGRYTSANPADQLYLPRNPHARADHAVLTLEQALIDEETDRQVLEKGESVVVEQELPTDKGLRTVLTYKALLHDTSGNAAGILGVDLDITEWRQAELALRETEIRYRTLVEQLPAITYTAALDRFASMIYVSPQISRLGFSAAEWVADPGLFARQLHPDDQERVVAAMAQLCATGEPLQIEYRIYTCDRRLLWMSDQAIVIYNQSGRPIQIQGMMFDITQRKEAEEALHDSVRRIRLIADNVPALIAYIDDQEIYRFANRKFQEWYATNDIVGKHLKEIAGERQYQAIRNYVDTALSGSPITFDYTRTYPDGRRRFVEIAYIPHFAAEGQVLGFFTLVQDLTERKVAEEQIKASLEEKVLLIKEIHHRVKNNLQVISSLLYLQAEQITDPRVRTILQDSQNRVKSMALIHEKLYQAKDQVRVDVAEYIQNLTGYLFRSYAAQASGIQLYVKVDNVQLGIDTAMPCGLIINELLSNALKHAFPAGRCGEIHVGLRCEPEGHYVLVVRDTGVGIPPEVDLQKNASLGLQLVHTLVKQLDANIEIHRAAGAEFRICFAEPH
ncbi:MAG: hypothetical protein DCC55_18495 [Chloroflexi bacterium]|nr:MAG: hypothetical protein DCC55_18495 [Chloroflexota bacterium]